MPILRPSTRQKLDEERALRLAETTDLSPKQALELIRRYGDDDEKLRAAAESFKAES
jgi:hypothetical protein